MDIPVIGPGIQCPGDKLRAIVNLDAFGDSPLFGDMLEDRTYAIPFDGFIRVGLQTLVRENATFKLAS